MAPEPSATESEVGSPPCATSSSGIRSTRSGPSLRTSLTRRRDGVELEPVLVRRDEQALELGQGLALEPAGIQPALPRVLGQHHRHPVVDRRHHLVRAGRDDRERADHLARVLVLPAGPEPGEGDRATVRSSDRVRLAHLPDALPLVVRVGRDQAAALREGVPERRVPIEGLGASVEHPVAGVRRVGPVGDQAPAIRRRSPARPRAGRRPPPRRSAPG